MPSNAAALQGLDVSCFGARDDHSMDYGVYGAYGVYGFRV